MKKLLQGAVLPFVIFTSGILLLGCDQATSPSPQEQHTSQSETTHSEPNHSSESEQKNVEDLKQGNMFYIARDVANVQLKTGNYVEKLQQAQSDLQQAIETKDQTELQNTVQTLTRELQAFNTALISLDLKSQEIDDIRQQVLHANKQVLNSSLLNGNLDISKVDFNKIQQQMDHIQTDMLKLAEMMIPTSENDKSSQS